MTTINLPSARALLASAEQHFEASEREASADGRQRATERASVMATMAVAAAIIERGSTPAPESEDWRSLMAKARTVLHYERAHESVLAGSLLSGCTDEPCPILIALELT